MAKRKNQKFKGELTDTELYLIEDALESFKNDTTETDSKIKHNVEVDMLIQTLYSNFWEVKI